MQDLQREILNQVASGQISAGEGAARLEALGAGAPTPPPPGASTPPAATTTAARSVKVISLLGTANIVADPTVAVAVAEGPHRARTDGDVLVIEHAGLDEGNDTFTFGGGAHRVVVAGPDLQRRSISIRMNPNLPLAATVQAGNLNVSGVRGAITAEVQAGNLRADGVRAPLIASVQAGNVSANGLLDSGSSRIKCEMGSVRLNLEKGSSLRITAHTTMGKVTVDGAGSTSVSSSEAMRQVTVGGGTGTLDIDCTMGSVKVNAE